MAQPKIRKQIRIPKETPEEKRARIAKIIRKLRELFPEATTSLSFENPFQLICATVLSAQCTDARVNKVTPELFRNYPDARSMSKAPLAKLEKLVQSTGFYKNKALSLSHLSKAIMEKHGGNVPGTMEELIGLRGVGRKTANVVLGNAFGVPGFPVDTHVGRLTRRLGLTKHLDPVKVEHEITALTPSKDWTDFSHLLIYHGRATCTARSPQCEECELLRLCPQVGVQ